MSNIVQGIQIQYSEIWDNTKHYEIGNNVCSTCGYRLRYHMVGTGYCPVGGGNPTDFHKDKMYNGEQEVFTTEDIYKGIVGVLKEMEDIYSRGFKVLTN